MLDIVPGLLLVTGVVFIFLLIYLTKVLYRPLMDFMENRERSIKKDFENAGKNSDDVAAYKEEAEAIILEAKTEAQKLKEDSIKRAKDDAMKRLEDKRVELEESYNDFIKDLGKERAELKEALLSQMALFKDSVKLKLSKI